MLTFNKKYFILTVLLFIVEVLIALFVRDRFVRPYVGDVLVVMLIYCFLKSFFRIGIVSAAVIVLLFAFSVEAMQYFRFIELIGWEHNRIARTVLGTHFTWNDIVAYVVGIGIVLVVEYFWKSQNLGDKA